MGRTQAAASRNGTAAGGWRPAAQVRHQPPRAAPDNAGTPTCGARSSPVRHNAGKRRAPSNAPRQSPPQATHCRAHPRDRAGEPATTHGGSRRGPPRPLAACPHACGPTYATGHFAIHLPGDRRSQKDCANARLASQTASKAPIRPPPEHTANKSSTWPRGSPPPCAPAPPYNGRPRPTNAWLPGTPARGRAPAARPGPPSHPPARGTCAPPSVSLSPMAHQPPARPRTTPVALRKVQGHPKQGCLVGIGDVHLQPIPC